MYASNNWQEYSDLDVIQMIGRAVSRCDALEVLSVSDYTLQGRPQFG